MTMTMEEMYQDLLMRGFIQKGPRDERTERASLWPWAVNSLNTTLIEAQNLGTSQRNADLEPDSH